MIDEGKDCRPETIHMDATRALELLLIIYRETDLPEHVYPMSLGPRANEGEIEAVSVVCRHDGRLGLSYMFEETSKGGRLVRLVEDRERTFVLGFGGVFEIVDVVANDLSVGDEEALPKREKVFEKISKALKKRGGGNWRGTDGLTCPSIIYEIIIT